MCRDINNYVIYVFDVCFFYLREFENKILECNL